MEEEFEIEISYDILRQVSSQLYTNPRRAIEELVCNSYDAAATECYVSTPKTTDDVLQVLDNGNSMDKDGLKILWEVAGGSKKRLAEQGRDRVIEGRGVEGRKQIGKFGVGKLAAFALGDKLTHVATTDGVTRIVTVSQEQIKGHSVSDPPKTEVFKMSEDAAKEFLGDDLEDVPDPWQKDWDTWTLAVVDNVSEDSSGRDLKAEYLDQMIRTAIPRLSNFTVYRNGREIKPREYPDKTYAEIENLADDEDAIKRVEEGLKKFWVNWEEGYEEKSDVPEEKYELEIKNINPYESTEDPETGDDGKVPAVIVDQLGPVIASGTIYEDTLRGKKLQDRNLHDYGFKVKVRGKLLNRGAPKFGTGDKPYKWFYRFVGEFEVPDLDDDILVQRDSVKEGLKPELTRAVMESFFGVLRTRAEDAEEKDEYDPGEFGHRLHSVSPYKAPQALEGLANRDGSDYPQGGWKDVDVHLAEHGRNSKAIDYSDGTIYVNEQHPLFEALKQKDLPTDLIKVIGEALAGNLIASGYLSYKNVRDELIDQSSDISEDALETASRYLQDPIEYYKDQIESMSYEGDDVFEQAIVDALNRIGVEAEHFGDSGDSDAIITFGTQGGENYRISLEAKGKGEGRVEHSQAQFSTALEHMKDDECNHTLFVAREFQLNGQGDEESKLLKQFRMHDELTLLTVEALQEMLSKHSERGFSHERIKQIMTTNVAPGEGRLLEVIEREWNKMPAETGIAWTVLEEAREIYLDETLDEPDIGMIRQSLRLKDKETISKEKIESVLILAQADSGMVNYDPDDNTFSIHQTPEQIIKAMGGEITSRT